MIANVARYESGIQAVAGRQSSAAPVHSRGEEDGCRKLSRNGMGSVSGIVRCSIVESMAVVLSVFTKLAD